MSHFLNLSLLKRNPNFGLLYAGQFISFLGTMITAVVLPYQVYSMTNSSMMVGLLSLAQLIPLLFTALLGGVIADRYNRRKLLLISELILGLGAVLLSINALSSSPSLYLVFILAVSMSAIFGLHRPALESVVQQIVTDKDYLDVGALTSFKYSFCMIVGPAIAGLIIAGYGIFITYLVDVLTFIVSFCCLWAMGQIPGPEHSGDESILSSLGAGIRFALSRQELLGSYLVDFISMVFAIPNALFPALAMQWGGAKTLGFLYAAPAVGALLISFVSGWTSRIRYDGRAIALAAGFWGLSMIGFGLATNWMAALFFLALSGALDAVSGIFRITLWNRTIPQSFRGRLAGIEMLSYLSGPKLGDARAGALASMYGLAPAIISGGILCVLGVVGCCFFMPKFWNFNDRSE